MSHPKSKSGMTARPPHGLGWLAGHPNWIWGGGCGFRYTPPQNPFETIETRLKIGF